MNKQELVRAEFSVDYKWRGSAETFGSFPRFLSASTKLRVAEAGLGLADVPSLPNCIAALHGKEDS